MQLSVIHLDEVYIVKTGHLIAEGGIAFVSLKSKQIHFDVQACSNAVIQLYHEDVAVPHYTEVRECKTLNQILQEKNSFRLFSNFTWSRLLVHCKILSLLKVYLGFSENTIILVKDALDVQLGFLEYPEALDCVEYRPFWISWSNGLYKVYQDVLIYCLFGASEHLGPLMNLLK